ncbi:hypothetical protein RRG08_010403 [Elysia crispata]|uniref:Uncharacterized protein n=1 Tax=Elysia crispata TaxID=231223 RepID=A0AAE1BCB1_9GAST|nr:hypothetical protein RRG08_010403 [Elysia crispata]
MSSTLYKVFNKSFPLNFRSRTPEQQLPADVRNRPTRSKTPGESQLYLGEPLPDSVTNLGPAPVDITLEEQSPDVLSLRQASLGRVTHSAKKKNQQTKTVH